MRHLTATQSTASSRWGKTPLLIIVSILFAMAFAACDAALADSDLRSSKDGANTANVAADGTVAISRDRATGEPPAGTAPINPDQLYQWDGVVEWVELEGGHFAINRGCDVWVVIPASDEVYSRLKDLLGQKATVWGNVNTGPSIYGRHSVNASSVFSPGEVRPLIAVPQIPCPKRDPDPVPVDGVVVHHSEIALHGDLVWRGGQLWLVTERGNVRLDLPRLGMLPDRALPQDGTANAEPLSLGEYGVVGTWGLENTGIVVKVREIKEWPFVTVALDQCQNMRHAFRIGPGQLAAHGTLGHNADGQMVLRTKSGIIFVHGNSAVDPALTEPSVNPDGTVSPIAPSFIVEAVVIGQWKTDGAELHMEGENIIRLQNVCEPPVPPRPVLLPGEIAALGTLVFEDGRAYLSTPQGKIGLLRQNDDATEPEPLPPSYFDSIQPEFNSDAAAGVDPANGEARPDAARPLRQILVVGKWLVRDGQLVIVVRYAIPWPYPYATPVDPFPIPGPDPVPPAQDLPVKPMPEDQDGVAVDGNVSGVEPTPAPAHADVVADGRIKLQ